MRAFTTLKFKDGTSETHEGFASFNVDDETVDIIDKESNVVGDDVQLDLLESVTTEFKP